MVLGLQRYTREDLERVRKAGEQLHIQVLGLASIDDDVPAKLAAQTIASISVLGALRASADSASSAIRPHPLIAD